MAKTKTDDALPPDVNPAYQRNGVSDQARADALGAALSRTVTVEGTDKRRFVNRNAHLKAAAEIVAILDGVDPVKWPGILQTVQAALYEQPSLPFIPLENQ